MKTTGIVLVALLVLTASSAVAQDKKKASGADAKAASCCASYGGTFDKSTTPGRCMGIRGASLTNYARCAGRM